MKHLLIAALVFLNLLLQAQEPNWHITKNTDLNNPLVKNFPTYIEVFIDFIGSPDNVIVKCNDKIIKPKGNIFYLPIMAYDNKSSWRSTIENEKTFYRECDKCSNYFSIELLPKGMQLLNKKRKELQIQKESITTNKISYIKIQAKKDSIYFGEKYKCYLIIDTNKIKDLSKIEILYFNFPLERRGNKFRYNSTPMNPKNSKLDFVVINKVNSIPDTLILEHKLNFIPLKGNRNNVDYVGYAEPMPKFRTDKYKSFKEYIHIKAKESEINIYGTYELDYTILKNGGTRFEGIKYGNLNFDEEDKLEQIINLCKYWTPGVYENKKVNVRIQEKFSFY